MNADPRYVTLATRLRSLRGELDRVDDHVQLFDRPERVELARHTIAIRAELDWLNQMVDQRATSRS